MSYRYRYRAKNFIPANQHTIRIAVYRKNTGMDIDTYTLIQFYFHSVQCIRDIVRMKDSFNFLLIFDSWYCFYTLFT